LGPEPLEKRLLKLFREARTFEEEQGVNILFLAIGFLNWFEDARSEERCSAPLLLVPVSLERRQVRDSFVMRGRDDDMIVNVKSRAVDDDQTITPDKMAVLEQQIIDQLNRIKHLLYSTRM
jgi:hypothetical protein